MDGLNLAYRVSPTDFMKKNVLTMNPSIAGTSADPRELATGLQHFDIRPLPYPNAAELKYFMDAGQAQHVGDRQVGMGGGVADITNNRPGVLKAIGVIWRPAPDIKPKPRENPILAYWLPYEADKTYEMTLGAEANYFFTAGLSGCCVVVSGDPTEPRVAHVNRTEAGSPRFQAVVAKAMAADEAIAERRARVRGEQFFSRTGKEAQTSRQILFQELKSKVAAMEDHRDTSHDLMGYCKWGEQYTSIAVVMGVRNQGSGVWSFYYQNYRNETAPSEHSALGFVTVRDGDLNRMA